MGEIMGLLDFLKKQSAGEKNAVPEPIHVHEKKLTVFAPATGRGVALADVPDPVFSGGVLGEGYGIWPEEGVIYAPVSGVVSATTPTMHALGLTSKDGLEILIHVGVDTVEMRGDGFISFVKQDEEVKAGQPLMSFDLKKIHAAKHPEVIIIAITNTSELAGVTPVEPTEKIEAGAPILCVSAKAAN